MVIVENIVEDYLESKGWNVDRTLYGDDYSEGTVYVLPSTETRSAAPVTVEVRLALDFNEAYTMVRRRLDLLKDLQGMHDAVQTDDEDYVYVTPESWDVLFDQYPVFRSQKTDAVVLIVECSSNWRYL